VVPSAVVPSAVVNDAVSTETATIDHAVLEGCSVSPDIPEIDFVRPLPGFPDLTRFVLVRLDGDRGNDGDDGDRGNDGDGGDGGDDGDPVLYELRSIERPQVRFLVAVPTAFFPHYSFELDESVCVDLEFESAEEVLVLVLLTIGDDVASTTANLLAPVVINARTRSAAQVILSGTDWLVRAAVV
jgi:flagellar assembly factor FliW